MLEKMPTKPKLLILTPRFPYPPVGGDRLRIYQICRSLAGEFELSLLSMCESKQEMTIPIPQDGVFSYVERVYHGRIRASLGCFAALFSSEPIQVGYYRNPEFAGRFQDLADHCDGVVAHLIRTGAYLTRCSLPKVVEMTDAISLTYQRGGAITSWNPIRALLYRLEANRLIKFEREIVRTVDLTVLVSAIDRDFLLADAAGREIQVCANGVDTNAFPFDYSPDERTIVFIGNNRAQHNVDAILYFVDQILPSIRVRRPGVQFKVIGPISDRLKRRLEREIGVIAVGEVKNVADAVKGASVGVCPVRFGAGIQNKLLEYMSLGIPAVTSEIGKEGLDVVPGEHLLVASSVREWADQICALLENTDLGRRVAQNSRSFVELEHSWPARMKPLLKSINDLICKNGRSLGTAG
jgi:glycosyltransferase involved in cell wall biosynthesis